MKSIMDKIWDNGRKTKDSRRFRCKPSSDSDTREVIHFNNKDRDDYGGRIKDQVLRKILRSRVGDKWSDIYSDLINSKMTDHQKSKLRETLSWMVIIPDTNGEIDSRNYRDDFIVVNNKLTYRACKTWKQIRKEQNTQELYYFALDGRFYYYLCDDPYGTNSEWSWYQISRNPGYAKHDEFFVPIDCGNYTTIQSNSSENGTHLFLRRKLSIEEFNFLVDRYKRLMAKQESNP